MMDIDIFLLDLYKIVVDTGSGRDVYLPEINKITLSLGAHEKLQPLTKVFEADLSAEKIYILVRTRTQMIDHHIVTDPMLAYVRLPHSSNEPHLSTWCPTDPKRLRKENDAVDSASSKGSSQINAKPVRILNGWSDDFRGPPSSSLKRYSQTFIDRRPVNQPHRLSQTRCIQTSWPLRLASARVAEDVVLRHLLFMPLMERLLDQSIRHHTAPDAEATGDGIYCQPPEVSLSSLRRDTTQRPTSCWPVEVMHPNCGLQD